MNFVTNGPNPENKSENQLGRRPTAEDVLAMLCTASEEKRQHNDEIATATAADAEAKEDNVLK